MVTRAQKERSLESLGRKITGAQILMEALAAEGVDTIFGYPGGAIMPTYDALYDYTQSNKIRHVLVRHEQGAGHAAEGWAWVKRRPGVVFATSGPGATNLITSVLNARLDSTPVVYFTGQVATSALGKESFQEAPIVEISKPITKLSYQLRSVDEIADRVHEAFTIAGSGRPGPVLIDVPKDVQNQLGYYHHVEPNGIKSRPTLTPKAFGQLQQAAYLLSQAQRPYILAGHGIRISGAEQELRNLAERANIPIANTLLGLSSIPADHPLFMGMVGMHGRLGANNLTNQADVILAMGMRFADRVTGTDVSRYAPQARVVHVDIDPTQLNKIVRAELAIQADAKQALSILSQLTSTNSNREKWLQEFRIRNLTEDEKVTRRALSSSSTEIKAAEVVHRVSELTAGEALLIADVGQHQMIAARYYRPKLLNSFITSGGAGTMGFALPAGIGAKIAAPNREVIVVAGDGSIQMNEQEFTTLAQEGIAVKTIIIDNRYLGMVRQWQDRFHGRRHSSVDMENPDFVTVAQARRIRGQCVTRRDQLDTALKRMLSAEESYVVHVMTSREENVYPMIPPGATVEQVLLGDEN